MTNDAITIIVFIWAVCAIVAGAIAARRGMNALSGVMLGAILGPFGVLLVAVQKPVQPVRWDR